MYELGTSLKIPLSKMFLARYIQNAIAMQRSSSTRLPVSVTKRKKGVVCGTASNGIN